MLCSALRLPCKEFCSCLPSGHWSYAGMDHLAASLQATQMPHSDPFWRLEISLLHRGFHNIHNLDTLDWNYFWTDLYTHGNCTIHSVGINIPLGNGKGCLFKGWRDYPSLFLGSGSLFLSSQGGTVNTWCRCGGRAAGARVNISPKNRKLTIGQGILHVLQKISKLSEAFNPPRP